MALPSARPGWFDDLYGDYLAGVATTFIVHGNVFDYVDAAGDRTVGEYLAATLSTQFSVATFAPDRGIGFGGPVPVAKAAAKRFRTLTGESTPDVLSDAERRLMERMGQSADPQSEKPLPTQADAALPLLVAYLAGIERAPIPADARDVDGRLARALLEDEKKGAVLVERLDLICAPGDKGTLADPQRALLAALHRVGTSRDLDQRESLLILLAPSLEEVHPDLLMASSGIRAVAVAPPDVDERLAFIERLAADEDRPVALEMGAGELAAQTAGLNRRHIEDIALRALRADGVITRQLVKERKSQQIATEYADTLTLLETGVTLDDIAGHNDVKTFLQEWVVGPATSGDPDLLEIMPKGILLSGPPGTGKTLLSQAIANALGGWNCVGLDGAKLKGSLVGESQRRRSKAMTGIRAMAPCVVFVDEFEQMMPRRVEGSGGSGAESVEADAFGSMLQFFGDPTLRGRVLLIGASNRPDLIDAAMFRPGRLDVKVPLLPPDDTDERMDVLQLLLAQRKLDAPAEIRRRIADDTDGWTQAELGRLVNMTAAIARLRQTPAADALLAARARLQPPTVAEAQRQTLLALASCDDAALVPARYRALVGKPVAPESESGPQDPYTGRRGARSDDF